MMTMTEAAEELDLEPQTLRLTVRTMREAGEEIGKQKGPTFPILLSVADVEAIKKWREEHPHGGQRAAG